MVSHCSQPVQLEWCGFAARCKLSNFNRNVKTFLFVPNEIWQFMQIDMRYDTTADTCTIHAHKAQCDPVHGEAEPSLGREMFCVVLFPVSCFQFDFHCYHIFSCLWRSIHFGHTLLHLFVWQRKKQKFQKISFSIYFFFLYVTAFVVVVVAWNDKMLCFVLLMEIATLTAAKKDKIPFWGTKKAKRILKERNHFCRVTVPLGTMYMYSWTTMPYASSYSTD